MKSDDVIPFVAGLALGAALGATVAWGPVAAGNYNDGYTRGANDMKNAPEQFVAEQTVYTRRDGKSGWFAPEPTKDVPRRD